MTHPWNSLPRKGPPPTSQWPLGQPGSDYRSTRPFNPWNPLARGHGLPNREHGPLQPDGRYSPAETLLPELCHVPTDRLNGDWTMTTAPSSESNPSINPWAATPHVPVPTADGWTRHRIPPRQSFSLQSRQEYRRSLWTPLRSSPSALRPAISETESEESSEEDYEEDTPATEQLRGFSIGDTGAVHDFYRTCFDLIQQIDCKTIAKLWVKCYEPKKQALHPYNGGARAKECGGDGELTRPGWWPREGCPHKEPDHIDKSERICLLTHLLTYVGEEKNPDAKRITCAQLKESTEELVRKSGAGSKIFEHLPWVYRVREQEERLRAGEIDADFTMVVPDFQKPAKKSEQSPKDSKMLTKRKRRADYGTKRWRTSRSKTALASYHAREASASREASRSGEANRSPETSRSTETSSSTGEGESIEPMAWDSTELNTQHEHMEQRELASLSLPSTNTDYVMPDEPAVPPPPLASQNHFTADSAQRTSWRPSCTQQAPPQAPPPLPNAPYQCQTGPTRTFIQDQAQNTGWLPSPTSFIPDRCGRQENGDKPYGAGVAGSQWSIYPSQQAVPTPVAGQGVYPSPSVPNAVHTTEYHHRSYGDGASGHGLSGIDNSEMAGYFSDPNHPPV